MNQKYKKLRIFLQAYLVGRGYHRALKAMALGQKLHNGVRKDNVTPEFQHQLEIALFITTLKDLPGEEECIVCALLHDVREDKPIEKDEIIREFGRSTADRVDRLSKVTFTTGIKKTPDEYFGEIAKDPVCAIVKAADRINNVQTMESGGFTVEKQARYVDEVENRFLPMMKEAAALSPESWMAFMNARTMLKNQVALVKNCLKYREGLE